MGQKGSHPSQEEINEYYQRRHSFYNDPDERRERPHKHSHSSAKGKRAKSREPVGGIATVHATNTGEVTNFYLVFISALIVFLMLDNLGKQGKSIHAAKA